VYEAFATNTNINPARNSVAISFKPILILSCIRLDNISCHVDSGGDDDDDDSEESAYFELYVSINMIPRN
jgi:hypothetical protein